MAGLPQLKAVSIRHTITEAIRQALLEGRFLPGQQLSEVALAQEMNVSRGPVRESLLVLAQEGLVKHSQNYGFSVLEFTQQDQLEVQQVRLPLEVLALQLARERTSVDVVRELSHLKDQMVESLAANRVVTCTQTDLAFHSLIWDLSGNSRLVASLRNLLVPYFAYGSTHNISRPDLTPELMRAQHQTYIAYLEGSDERSAEECVRFHAGL